MLTLIALAELVEQHRDALALPVAPLRIGAESFDTDVQPVLMGTVNLSRDSTYRESIAVSPQSAIRKAQVMAAAGAHLVDIGAESSTARAGRVDAVGQAAALEPVIKALAADGVAVSAETYEPEVARAALTAGASVINLTGREHEHAIFDAVADHSATVIMCFVPGANVREITDAGAGDDPVPMLLDHFATRIEVARRHGVDRIVIDPGLGFYYRDLVDPTTRVRFQARSLLHTFRLRELGLPVCHALPHAFDLFEEEFRTAEAFFAVLARLGGAGVLRTHEVPRVRAIVRAMTELHA